MTVLACCTVVNLPHSLFCGPCLRACVPATPWLLLLHDVAVPLVSLVSKYILVLWDFALVSRLSPFSPNTLSPTCRMACLLSCYIHLSPLVSAYRIHLAECSEALGRQILHLLHLSVLVSDLSRPTLNTLGRMTLHVSPLGPLRCCCTCLQLSLCSPPCLDARDFASLLFSLLRHSWPDAFTLFPHTGLPVRGSYFFERGA